MQLIGSNSLRNIRQPTNMKHSSQEGQRLVFLYPMLFDSQLQKYANDLRDFMCIDFISQIKLSNINSVISDAVNFNTTTSNNKYTNPTQQILKSLNHMNDDSIPDFGNYKSYDNEYTLAEYQRRIHELIHFIKNQLKYDSRYNVFRPIISSISVQENLLQIPLILGTKHTTINANALYLILSISILYGNLPLNKESSLDKIMDIIKNADSKKLLTMLFDDKYRNNLKKDKFKVGYGTPDRKINDKDYWMNRINSYVSDETKKACISLKKMLNINKWNVETHNLGTTSSSTSESVPVIQTKNQKKHFDNAMNSFSAYVSSFIIPALHSLESLMGPIPSEIDFNQKINTFTEHTCHSMSQIFNDVTTHLTSSLIDYTKDTHIRLDNAQVKIDELRNMCHNNKTNTQAIEKQLNILEQNIRIPIRFHTDDIINFSKSISETAYSIKPYYISIENFLLDFVVGETQLENMFTNIKNRFKNNVETFFYKGEQYSLYDDNIDNGDLNLFRNRYGNFHRLVCGRNDDLKCLKFFIRTINNISNSISELLWFFFIWNFFSYMCEYINDIEIDIDIQRKDVLDFPNYCMVIPLDIFKYLYTIYNSRNLQQLLKSKNPDKDPELDLLKKYDYVNPNLNNINKMINIINDQLKVPNLMVIDNYKNMVYYQFMHMSWPNKISLQNLDNYIKHQKDIIPGF